MPAISPYCLAQGVTLKLRYNRAGHLFEFPILLSSSPDATVAAAAYALVPLVTYLAKSWVVDPLASRIEKRRWGRGAS